MHKSDCINLLDCIIPIIGQVSPGVKAWELFFVYGRDQSGQWVRARFKGDIHRKQGVREIFKPVSSLHGYNLHQFAWWVLEKDRLKVPPMKPSADPFEARFFPKYYSIEGDPGPRPHPADIPFKRGDFVTIVACYVNEQGVTRRLDELGYVEFTFKASPQSSRLYHILFAEQNFVFETLYDHDLCGPKVEWIRPPAAQECWWRREIYSQELKDDLRYLKEPRQGFEVDHIVSVAAASGQERLPARVVKTWLGPAQRHYEVRPRLAETRPGTPDHALFIRCASRRAGRISRAYTSAASCLGRALIGISRRPCASLLNFF